MKKKIHALILGVFVALASCSAVFADGLSIVDITPADGSKGYQPANMAVKVRFSEDMMDEAAIAVNRDKFVIADPEGTQFAYDVVYNASKHPDELWVVLQDELAPNTEYTVTIEAGIVSSLGNTLTEGMSTTFRTRDTKIDGLVSMGLVAVMMFAMFGMTSRSVKKAQEKEDPKAAQKLIEDSLNPYKIAKQKGISLAEAQAIVDKEREKIDKRMARAEAERIRYEEKKEQERKKMEEELEFFGTDENELKSELRAEGIYLVKGPRSIKDAGGRVPRSVRQRREERRRRAAEKAKNAQKNKRKK